MYFVIMVVSIFAKHCSLMRLRVWTPRMWGSSTVDKGGVTDNTYLDCAKHLRLSHMTPLSLN